LNHQRGKYAAAEAFYLQELDALKNTPNDRDAFGVSPDIPANLTPQNGIAFGRSTP
jgi:hypothetical protein